MVSSNEYDVVVIGAGIAGSSVSRELSRFELSIALIEKEPDICFGTTKGTHAIVHSCLSNKSTPLRNMGEAVGNLHMEKICYELDVPYKKTGKFLVAFSQKELEVLRELEFLALSNHVPKVELILDKRRIKEMEPNLSEEVQAVLYTPSTGIVSPWDLVFGFTENAVANGVELFTNTTCNSIKVKDGGFVVETNIGEFKASYIINAAGAYAGKIAGMVGDRSFKISGVRMQRVIFDKTCDGLVNRILRDINGSAPGDFIMPTVHGNIMAGTKNDLVDDISDTRTTRDGIDCWVLPEGKKIIPNLDKSKIIRSFSGVIAMAGDDYLIRPAIKTPKFINMVLGGSGITTSQVMAKYIIDNILTKEDIKLVEKKDFNPYRKDMPHINELSNKKIDRFIENNPLYGHIVCRCENVSEGEIIDAIKRGARTLDGIKYRTRAGMGRCQGGFCTPRILKIMSRELGIPVTEITKKGGDSLIMPLEAKELLLDKIYR